jgi:hypothetical protein
LLRVRGLIPAAPVILSTIAADPIECSIRRRRLDPARIQIEVIEIASESLFVDHDLRLLLAIHD